MIGQDAANRLSAQLLDVAQEEAQLNDLMMGPEREGQAENVENAEGGNQNRGGAGQNGLPEASAPDNAHNS